MARSGTRSALAGLVSALALVTIAPMQLAKGAVGIRSSSAAARQELSSEQREWLDLVSYIIDKDERRVFEGLSTDWQRQRFIEAFWKRRDPEPVTPENEFRLEYMRRWKYVNDVFGRDTPVPGWRTDRGRVYLVNGPPYQVHPYPNTQELWPLEIWEYRDSPRPGMPSFYEIIFFKPRVFNEWRLYSPAVDGPQGLIIASPADLDQINLPAIATKFPLVFEAAQQAAPGLGPLGSEALIARTMAPPVPPRPLSLYYSSAGDVESAFLDTGPLDFRVQAVGFAHPEIEGYVDVTIEVPAETTTFVPVDGELVANYQVELEIDTPDTGTWHDPAGAVVVRVPTEDRSLAEELPIQFTKRLWLLPGSYEMRALLTEVATHRVGAVDTRVVVPERRGIVVGSPELFYVTEKRASSAAGSAQVPWVERRLRRGQAVGCLVRVLNAGEEGDVPAETFPEGLGLEYRITRAGEAVWTDVWSGDSPPLVDDGGWTVVHNLHIEDLPTGSYELEVRTRLPVGGDSGSVEVRPVGRRPIEIVDQFLPVARLLPVGSPPTDLAEGHHSLGQQLLRRDDFAGAREHFERAVRLAPRNPTFQIDAAKSLILDGELSVAEFLLSEAVNRAPDSQDAYATLGLLQLQRGDPSGAVGAYERALDLAPGTPAIYNGLAEAYLSLGDTGHALEMLDASLEINADQTQVRELRDRLREGGGEVPATSR